jgi:hypothetical protein
MKYLEPVRTCNKEIPPSQKVADHRGSFHFVKAS